MIDPRIVPTKRDARLVHERTIGAAAGGALGGVIGNQTGSTVRGATDLLIVGHTDAVGTGEYNQALSERRAAAAGNYLTGQGVSSGRLRALGRGETESIAANDTELGRQLNRRVEVAIFANAQARKQ